MTILQIHHFYLCFPFWPKPLSSLSLKISKESFALYDVGTQRPVVGRSIYFPFVSTHPSSLALTRLEPSGESPGRRHVVPHYSLRDDLNYFNLAAESGGHQRDGERERADLRQKRGRGHTSSLPQSFLSPPSPSAQSFNTCRQNSHGSFCFSLFLFIKRPTDQRVRGPFVCGGQKPCRILWTGVKSHSRPFFTGKWELESCDLFKVDKQNSLEHKTLGQLEYACCKV